MFVAVLPSSMRCYFRYASKVSFVFCYPFGPAASFNVYNSVSSALRCSSLSVTMASADFCSFVVTKSGLLLQIFPGKRTIFSICIYLLCCGSESDFIFFGRLILFTPCLSMLFLSIGSDRCYWLPSASTLRCSPCHSLKPCPELA